MANHQLRHQTPHKSKNTEIMAILIPTASSSATHPNYATNNPMTPYNSPVNLCNTVKLQPLQRNHSPSASDDADNAANIHSHKTPPRPRIISTPPRAPTPPNQCCSATHPATSHQPTNSIATNLDPSLRTPPLMKPTPIPFFRPIRPARPNKCRHAAYASEHTQAPIPLHPSRSKTLTNALDHHTAIPRNEAPSITSTPPFQRADQICVPSRPGTHQIRWSHATLTVRRQRGGRQRTTPTTNHGGDEPRWRRTTAAINDGGNERRRCKSDSSK
eukprot:CAMPEP_0201868898 /NCGR_PEP_ID=MMETSP0902-20130614/2609_1 /ASSEMBLY_ACC=CAM_ASM_000551 /TAXON_ID=420261 /ORGANISM="Thalassiosira antarctica, Strain CCMP982" /LENGTH=272 /DNA_ID=CAMNT_0048394299 /DNA_START=70 /DNA_END=886 /DNA_ORIENTATION=+